MATSQPQLRKSLSFRRFRRTPSQKGLTTASPIPDLPPFQPPMAPLPPLPPLPQPPGSTMESPITKAKRPFIPRLPSNPRPVNHSRSISQPQNTIPVPAKDEPPLPEKANVKRSRAATSSTASDRPDSMTIGSEERFASIERFASKDLDSVTEGKATTPVATDTQAGNDIKVPPLPEGNRSTLATPKRSKSLRKSPPPPRPSRENTPSLWTDSLPSLPSPSKLTNSPMNLKLAPPTPAEPPSIYSPTQATSAAILALLESNSSTTTSISDSVSTNNSDTSPPTLTLQTNFRASLLPAPLGIGIIKTPSPPPSTTDSPSLTNAPKALPSSFPDPLTPSSPKSALKQTPTSPSKTRKLTRSVSFAKPPPPHTKPPNKLSEHLQSSGPTPRKLFLATHAPFLRSAASGKLSPHNISLYLTQERIFLHAQLRFLGILMANVVLPLKPSGLTAPRRGGIKSRALKKAQDEEIAAQNTQRDKQKDFGPGMGGSLGVEIASGAAGMALNLVIPGLAGLGTGVGLRVGAGGAGVGLQRAGNEAVDRQQGRIEEIDEGKNFKRDIGERTMDWVISAINRTRTELEVFEEVAEDIRGVSLESSPRPLAAGNNTENANGAVIGVGIGGIDGTAIYIQLLEEVEQGIIIGDRSILDGLILLYAREKCKLAAWAEVGGSLMGEVKRKASVNGAQKTGSSGGSKALKEYLLEWWTGREALEGVVELGMVVDGVWEGRFGKGMGSGLGGLVERRDRWVEGNGKGWEGEVRGLEELWEMVLDIQGRFWPELR